MLRNQLCRLLLGLLILFSDISLGYADEPCTGNFANDEKFIGERPISSAKISRTSADVALWAGHFPGEFDFPQAEWKTGGDRVKFLQDLIMIQRLMQDPNAAVESLRPLGVALVKRELDKSKTPQGPFEPTSLEQTLTEMETAHLFPTYRLVALNVLPPELFLGFARSGFVLTDIGAGVEHGEMAHRLQWAMIMAVYDKNPKMWSSTPFELYIRIGEHDTTAGVPSIFGYLFDQDGDALGCGLGKNGPDGYRHPNRLTNDLRAFAETNKLKSDKDFGLWRIAKGVKIRRDQRFDALVKSGTVASGPAMRTLSYLLDDLHYKDWNGGRVLFVHPDDEVLAKREMNDRDYATLRIAVTRLQAKKMSQSEFDGLFGEISDDAKAAIFPN